MLIPLVKPPSDLALRLHELADAVDAGAVTGFVSARTENGSYEFLYGASLTECLLMATLLQQNCIDRMRA